MLQPGLKAPNQLEMPAQTQWQDLGQGRIARKAPTISKRGRAVRSTFKPVPPINWMRGQKQYSLQDALNNVTPKISFLQLLDVTPHLRRELAELLQSSVPCVRKKGKGKVARGSTEHVGVVKHTPLIVTEVHDDSKVHCLYINV